MHLPRLLLALLVCFALGPAVAQDGGGDDEGIEISEDPPEGEAPPAGGDDGYDPEETKKKNAGLAGGGAVDEGDANAPKVKGDLQTRINEAIARGVKWLKKAQDKNGSWGPVRADTFYNDKSKKGDFVRDELGPTAWAVYTLAKCGLKKGDDDIKDGLAFLLASTEFVRDVQGGDEPERDASLGHKEVDRSHPRELTTYESAAIVLMIEAVFEGSAKLTGKHTKRKLYTDNPLSPPVGSKIPEIWWKRMHDRILFLTIGRTLKIQPARATKPSKVPLPGAQNTEQAGANAGGWRYENVSGDADLSASQFVLLALRAASQAGYPVEKTAPKVWELAAKYAMKCQGGDGGFGYQVGQPSYASMTACGVGSLIICREQMALAGVKPVDGIDDAIEKGTAWLDQRFEAAENKGATEGQHLNYYLYGIERVGDLAGRKEFNGKDWYLRGATLLLERQDAEGKWVDATSFRPHDVLGTTFALLFLKRATIPVVTISEKGPVAEK